MTEVMQGRLTVIDAIDMLLLRHPELGLSTYDRHADGSGVATSSRLRPAHQHAPERPVVELLRRSVHRRLAGALGDRFDVVTDEDLHREGLDAAARHTACWSPAAIPNTRAGRCSTRWRRSCASGGRLMYLGGNGFYWRIAHHPTQPGIIEVRRAEDGTRAWDAEPGEYYHAFTGEYGGLWRRNGRPPQALAGVGFISQGFDHSPPITGAPGADDPRAAFIFEGVPERVIGDFGTMQGGAAGLEIDCVDPLLGTPPHALVLASSADHSNTYELVNEEVRVAHGMTDGLLSTADPRRHGVLRDAGRRCGVLDRLDRLCRRARP